MIFYKKIEIKAKTYNYLFQVFKDWVKGVSFNSRNNSFVVHIKPSSVKSCIRLFRDHTPFLCKSLVDISVTDFFGKSKRFEVNYFILSVKYSIRVQLKFSVSISESNFICDSVYDIFKSANWLERECWDLFGIFFNNHPDLRRILTDYGFNGHPIRKDFPLMGFVEVSYNEEKKRVVCDSLKISQEFRVYNFSNYWHV